MQIQTLIPAPVQTGEPFRCWECGSPDHGGMFLVIARSPLQAYADHIYYLRLTCGHNPRCVRLGDAIAPLPPLDRSIEENLASVRTALTGLVRALPPNTYDQDPVAKIIHLLIAGRIAPQTAIDRLHDLIDPANAPIALPSWKQAVNR